MGAYKIRKAPGLHPVLAQFVHERIRRNLSQAALAERLGISQVVLSRWENGTRDVAFSDIIRWAAALDLILSAAEPQIPEGPLPELTAGGLA